MAKPVKLPTHLREGPNKKSKYYDGRYAQGHPNWYKSEERTTGVVLAMLQRARKALEAWSAHPDALPIQAVADLKTAYESLSDIHWHLPEVVVWCVWTEYLPRQDGSRFSDSHVVWSGHLSQKEAEAWLPLWKEKFKDTKDYGWHVSLHPCGISSIRDPEVRTPKSL